MRVKDQKSQENRDRIIQYLESSGWQKLDGQDAWKKKNWKDVIIQRSWKMTFGEWDRKIIGRQSVWELVEKDREFDPEGFYVARLKKAYRQQLKIDAAEKEIAA